MFGEDLGLRLPPFLVVLGAHVLGDGLHADVGPALPADLAWFPAGSSVLVTQERRDTAARLGGGREALHLGGELHLGYFY